MPGIIGLIARHGADCRNLRRQYDAMAALVTHLDYYRTETLEGTDYCIGCVEIPHRGYHSVRADRLSGRQVVFHGFVYGWRGPSPANDPSRTEPVAMIPLDGSKRLDQIPDCINGAFVVCLYSPQEDRFALATDRLGYKQLYYYQDDQVIAFAPEIKAFMGIESFRREVDRDGASDFFNYGFLSGASTFYRGVSILPRGAVLNIEKRSLTPVRRYWRSLDFTEVLEGDLDRRTREMYELARETLNLQMGGHDKFFLALSGGADSRLLAHFLSETPAEAFYCSHGHPRCDDVRLAGQVADTLGIKDRFRVYVINPECYAHHGALSVWLQDGMASLTSSPLLDVLNQYDFDPMEFEFLNSLDTGTLNFTLLYASRLDLTRDLTFAERAERFAPTFGFPYLNDDFYVLFATDFRELLRRNARPRFEAEVHRVDDVGHYFAQKKCTFFAETRDQRLSKQYDLNKVFYHNHQALIDHVVLEERNATPVSLLVDRAMYTRAYRDIMPELGKIVYQHTGVPMSSEPDHKVEARRKRIARAKQLLSRLTLGRVDLHDYHTYVYHDHWYRAARANRDLIEGVLLDRRTFDRGYYNRREVERLLRRERLGSSSFGPIAALTTFELFNRYFIDGDSPPRLQKAGRASVAPPRRTQPV